MEINLHTYNETGGFNPYNLKWGEEIEFPNTRSLSEYGNRIYNRYPARSIFTVPRAILYQHKNKKLNILDPFMGSGTSAVETVISGNIPYGTEMDPFARIVAEASTSIFSKSELDDIQATYNKIVNSWNSYPVGNVPNLVGIERWFKEGDLNKLLQLRECIIKLSPIKFINFFIVVFADCIKPVSKMERQSTKPYISSKFEKKTKDVIASFQYSFNAHFDAISNMSLKLNYEIIPRISWLGNNATEFKANDDLIDIAITSPPYINAFDYSQCIKVESALCGIMTNELMATIRNIQVGHSKRNKQPINPIVENLFSTYFEQLNKINTQKAKTCIAYFNDMFKNLNCVYNSLKTNGEYHIIIGDSIICGIEIPTHKIIADLATYIGYDFFGYYLYKIKDHRTSIPRDNESSKIKYEHVIMLKK